MMEKIITKEIKIGEVNIGGNNPLGLIAGPCVIESEELALRTAHELIKIAQELKIPLIYKSSYDKANRTCHKSYRGTGLEEGLKILMKVKNEFKIPVTSDIHLPSDVDISAHVLDLLQIPAFLSRQTDLLLKAGDSGKPVNVKKGQFLAPWDMSNVIEKIESTGNTSILLTERGTSFGYNNLVVDMRSIVIMRKLGYPVVFDGTHSVQIPGGLGNKSGGEREYVPYLLRAAVAAGCDAVFIEVHPEPDKALCDGPNMLSLKELPDILRRILLIRRGVELS